MARYLKWIVAGLIAGVISFPAIADNDKINIPLTCRHILEGLLPPTPDGRVSYACDRAYALCLWELAGNIQLKTLASTPDSPEKKQEISRIKDLLSQTDAERKTSLLACGFIFNFFLDPSANDAIQLELEGGG